MANLTLSADRDLIDKARAAARRQGSSLNDMVREYLRSVAGLDTDTLPAQELLELMRTQGGHSRGEGWRRDDLYRERLG